MVMYKKSDAENDTVMRKVVYVARDGTEWTDLMWAQTQDDFLALRRKDKYLEFACSSMEAAIQKHAGHTLTTKQISLIIQQIFRQRIFDDLINIKQETWDKIS